VSTSPRNRRRCATAIIVADKLDLRRDIEFNCRIRAATYNEAENQWDLESEDGRRARARVPDHGHRAPLGADHADHSGRGELPR